MKSTDDESTPVKARAALIDPGSMTVLWTNEPTADASIDRVVPMSEALGVPKALHAVAETGVAQHLRADLISTNKGSMAVVVSIYRVPDGNLLVLAENAWHFAQGKETGSAPRGPGRRAR
jgi:hypothetical protein